MVSNSCKSPCPTYTPHRDYSQHRRKIYPAVLRALDGQNLQTPIASFTTALEPSQKRFFCCPIMLLLLNLQKFSAGPLGATCPFSPLSPFFLWVCFFFVLSCPWSSWATTPLRRCSVLFIACTCKASVQTRGECNNHCTPPYYHHHC